MLDLNDQLTPPRYELKLTDGEVKSYDSLLLSYGLRTLDAEGDPAKIQEVVNKLFDIDVDSFTTLNILNDFTTFAEETLEEPLKKVFGREFFSTTSTASRPENAEP